MADSTVNAANQVVNTTQPKPLRGLKIRGVREVQQVTCVLKNEDGSERIYKVRKADFDPEKHTKYKEAKAKKESAEDEGEQLIPKKKKKKKAK